MNVGHPPPASSASNWTEPPWSGWIETTGDALLVLEAARQGLIPRVTRRLVDSERRMITSGSVFVFDEDESGIKRWTDGFFWSPSRILGNFLLYRETDKRGAGHRSARAEQELMQQEAAASSAVGGLHIENQSLSRPKADNSGLSVDKQRERALIGSLTNSYKFKPDGLMKKTFSVTINGVAQHLISYYKIADVESGRLRSPSSLPELAALDISPEYLDKTHFRNPPKVEIGVDGIPRYRGESDDIEGNGSMSAAYQTGPSVGQGTGDMANNMLGGPVLANEQRHLIPDHLSGASGNIGAKRSTSTRIDSYGSPPQQKRSRKNTRSSEPPTGLEGSSGSSTSTSTSDHQPHGIHQSPQLHHMSVSPRLTAPQHQQPQSGGLVTYDPAAPQHQYQYPSLHQHLQAQQRSQVAQQQQANQYQQQQQQPAQPNQQPLATSYPPPQYLPFYSVPPPGYPPVPPPGVAGQPPQTYGQYASPYGPAPPAYWHNIPSSVMAASPMSTNSDSPSPSPMHLTHAHAHAQQRRSSISSQSQNPTSGLQNVAAVGTDHTTTNPNASANTNANTNTNTRNEPPGPRSDPSQKPPGQLPRQEPPVQQHHHPPAAATTVGGGAQGATTNTASSGLPVSTTTGAHTSTSTPAPGASPFYPYYPPPIPPPGHPHAYAHMPPPTSAPPVMGSLNSPPQQLGTGPPGQPPATMPIGMGMHPAPMQGMMQPMPFAPGGGPYQWAPPLPHPGPYPGYITSPPVGVGMGPGVYGYAPPYGVGVPGASGAGQMGGTGGGAAAGQGQAQTQSVGASPSGGAGQSGGMVASPGGGGGARAGTSRGSAAES